MKIQSSWRIIILFVFVGCGGESPSTSDKDFIGHPSTESHRVASSATSKANTLQDMFTVDLISDMVFRFQRDGWTLKEKSDVTASKLKAGGVDVIFSAVGVSPAGKPNLIEGIELTHQLVSEAGPDVRVARTFDEALTNSRHGVVSVMILVEGATGLENATLDELFALKKRGVAAIGLVSGRSNALADAAVSLQGAKGGLTAKGALFVEKLHEAGIAVDLTHASKRVFYDVLVNHNILAMVSHSAAATLREHPRNIDDVQILALARYGGILGLVFNPDFLVAGQSNGASIEDVLAHMVHIKKIGAIDGLSLGTDYAGIHPPKGLRDISMLPKLAKKMRENGFSNLEVEAVFGQNAKRYFENVAAQSGTAEMSNKEVLRPIELECETVIGEFQGSPIASCDNRIVAVEGTIRPGSRQKFRLRNMALAPVELEIFGVPDTPWQVEAQDLSGKVLIKRGIRLDENGTGYLPLPANRNLTRLFLNPTRPSKLREVVIWGR